MEATQTRWHSAALKQAWSLLDGKLRDVHEDSDAASLIFQAMETIEAADVSL